MMNKIRILIAIIFFLFFLQSKEAEAQPCSLEDVFIAKDAFNRAELICAGKADTIFEAEYDTVAVEGIFTPSGPLTFPGYWEIAQFTIDHLIKGKVISKTIKVKFFSPTAMRAYFEPIPTGKRCLLFLIPLEDVEYTYELLYWSGSIVYLAPLPPEGFPPAPEPFERLKAEMLNSIKSQDPLLAVWDMKCLKRLKLMDNEVIATLKELSKGQNPKIAGTAIAVRIEMGDRTALADAKTFIGSGQGSEVESRSIASAVWDNAMQDQIEELAEFLNLNDVYLRRAVVHFFRVMENKSLLPYLVNALDDSDSKVRFNAVMGLEETIGHEGEFSPGINLLNNETKYIQYWKEWWNEKGKTKYLKNNSKK